MSDEDRVPPEAAARRSARRPDANRFDGGPAVSETELRPGRIRTPVYLSIALVGVVVVVLPLTLGLHLLAILGGVIVGVLALSLKAVEKGPAAFRKTQHLIYFLCLSGVTYGVFGLGIPPVITVHFPAIMLLAAADLVGTRAAIAWAIPSLILVAVAAFAPPETSLVPSSESVFITRASTLLTVLGFAISFRRWRDRQSEYLLVRASTDSLTGLANRRALDRALYETLQRSARFGRRGALALIDLDGMKRVNDRLGHEAGDELLQIVATRLAASTRQVDTAARIGGDEFVVLLTEYETIGGARTFARRLLSGISAPCEIGGEMIEPSASIGIALFPDAASHARDLLHRADEAMYEAKRAGGGRVAWTTGPPQS